MYEYMRQHPRTHFSNWPRWLQDLVVLCVMVLTLATGFAINYAIQVNQQARERIAQVQVETTDGFCRVLPQAIVGALDAFDVSEAQKARVRVEVIDELRRPNGPCPAADPRTP